MALRWIACAAVLAPSAAVADPVSIATVAIGAAAAGASAALPAAGIAAALGVSATIASAIVAGGVAVVGAALTFGVQMAFGGRPKSPRPPDLIRELARADSLSPKRFVYGRTRTYGTPNPYEVVGDWLFGALILNSRPSAGGVIEIEIDKVPLTLVGDIYSAQGATTPTEPFAGFARFWLTLGDQTAPPAGILSAEGSPFLATDAWTGCTVLWVLFEAGPSNSRGERWRRVPPDVEIIADWSMVWDPRNPAQDAGNPATWAWSRNPALIALDALRQNPARPYPMEQIQLPSFVAAANAHDEAVPVKAGGVEPRYTADGIVIWNGGEIEDLVSPIVDAAAANLVRVGSKVGMTTGTWQPPVATLTDVLGQEFTFEVLQPGRDLGSEVHCRYTAPERGHEMADLSPLPVSNVLPDGARSIIEVELPWVTRARQAMRIQKIIAKQQEYQRRMQGLFPPAALAAVAGSTVTVDLPAPFAAIGGTYRMAAITPSLTVSGDGLSMRCLCDLAETGADVYAWDAATDEQDIIDGVAVASARLPLSPPVGPLLVTSGADTALDTQGGIVPRVLMRWSPTGSTRAVGYEIEYRIDGGAWQSMAAALEQIDGDGRVFAYISPVEVGRDYEVRVRAVGPGMISAWLTAAAITAAGPAIVLAAPTNGAATGGSGQISVTFTVGNDSNFRGIEFFGSDTDDSAAAATISGVIYGSPNAVYGFTEGMLGADRTRYYFARAVGPFGAQSPFSASASATTNSA